MITHRNLVFDWLQYYTFASQGDSVIYDGKYFLEAMTEKDDIYLAALRLLFHKMISNFAEMI